MPNFVCVQTYLWVCRAHVQSHEDLTLSFLNAYYDASAVTRMNTQVYVRVRTVCIQVHKLSPCMNDSWGTEMFHFKCLCGNAHRQGG